MTADNALPVLPTPVLSQTAYCPPCSVYSNAEGSNN